MTDNCYVPSRRPDKIMSYRISGPFFFGVAASVSAVLDAIGPRPEVFILDLTGVPLADAAAAHALASFAKKAKKRKTRVFIVGANARVRGSLEVKRSLPPISWSSRRTSFRLGLKLTCEAGSDTQRHQDRQ